LKAEIPARVRAGETVQAICAEPDMPRQETVYLWARKDPAFAEDLKAAIRLRQWKRHCAFDAAKAEAFLTRYRAGERIHAILHSPGLPSRRTYRYWRATQGEFAAEVHRLDRMRRLESSRRLAHDRRRVWTEALVDRLHVRVARGTPLRRAIAEDPVFPGFKALREWLREHPDNHTGLRIAMKVGQIARCRARTRRTPELTRRIVERIVEGESLYSLAGQPGMPSLSTLYKWVATDEGFANQIAQACEDREHWYREHILAIAETAAVGTVTATRRAMAPWTKQMTRLRNRPGKKWRTG
jgi:hypothetical protein